MQIHINNEQAILPVRIEVWQIYLRQLCQTLDCPEETIVSLTLTDNDTIQALNHEYRQIDKPTDVLAFSQDMENNLLGDIVISIEQAQQQALEKEHSLERELAVLIAHGLLHLRGYDHQESEEAKIMFAKQDELIKTHCALFM